MPNTVISEKDIYQEQVLYGIIAAFITKLWLAFLTNLMRHPKLSKKFIEAKGFLA